MKMSFYDRAKVWAVKGLKPCCCFPMSSFCMTYGFMLMAVKGLALWFVCLWESKRSKRSFRNSKGQHRGRMTPQTSRAFWAGSIIYVCMSVSVCVSVPVPKLTLCFLYVCVCGDIRLCAHMNTIRACLCASVFSLQAEERSLWSDKDE